MNRTRLLSGLVCAGLTAAAALGQQPPAVKKTETKPSDSAKDTLEQAIAAALRNNPDVRVAEAEAQVAQAKLAQAKLKVAQQVAAAHHTVQEAKDALKRVQELAKAHGVAAHEAEASAKAQVGRAEAELNALLGAMPGQAVATVAGVAFAPTGRYLAVERDGQVLVWDAVPRNEGGTLHLRLASPPGSVADKLREALDKPVKLPDQSGVHLEPLLTELTRAAGPDIRVRVPVREDRSAVRDAAQLDFKGGEYPLGAWLQLILDESARVMFRNQDARPGDLVYRPARYEMYVRDYGLLVADPATAPPGAVTVQEFWKQARAEKAAKERADAEKAKEPKK